MVNIRLVIIIVIVLVIIYFTLFHRPIFGYPIPDDICKLKKLDNEFYPDTTIDAVITWVDASDQDWLKKKNDALTKLHNLEKSKISIEFARFNNENDIEICLCLRLILKNLEWVNKLYVLTMRPQIPDCLKKTGILYKYVVDGKIVIVYHDQIFDENIDVFNAYAIESQIMNIPGLSEKFLNFNDDFYCLKPHPPSYYFTKTGKPIIRYQKFMKDNFLYNLYGKYGKSHIYSIRSTDLDTIIMRAHVFVPVTKQIMFDSKDAYKSEWDKVSKSVFRSSDTIDPLATAITRSLIKTGKAVLIDHKQDLLKILYKEDVNIKPKQLLKYDSACFNDLSKKDQRKLKKMIEDTILN